MYVTIENSHYCITSHDTIRCHPRLPFIFGSTFLPSHSISVECNGIDSTTLKPSSNTTDYRPTRLIRTSDMVVVPGSEATNGYCALSYPWECSGDVEYQKNDNNNNNDEHDNETTKTSAQSCTSRQRQQKVLVDRGEHTHITRRPSSLHLFYGSPQEKNYEGKRRRSQSEDSIYNDNYEPIVRKVTFKRIIQQLCWMFEIDYIWYDQLCIEQSDLQDKQNEIRQMHKIYGNAQFTLVMIPEMQFECPLPGDTVDRRPTATSIQGCIQQIATSKWATRAWTFEEAVLSKRLLFVGRDVHLWSDTIISTEKPWKIPASIYTNVPSRKRHRSSNQGQASVNDDDNVNNNVNDKDDDNVNGDDINETGQPSKCIKSRHYNANDERYVRFVQNICSNTSDTISASSALWHIHRGESTQDHDKIFAVANIFPHLIDNMDNFSYNQPLLPLMTRFYSDLIRHDLSVLCFGKEATHHDDIMYHYGTVDQRTRIIIIPSWTGVSGSHMLQTPTHPTPPTTSFGRYYITDGYLTVHSKPLIVFIEPLDRCPHASSAYTFSLRHFHRFNTYYLMAFMDNASYRQIISYGLTPTHWLQRQYSNCSNDAAPDTNTGITKALTSDNNNDNTVTAWFSLTTDDVNLRNCAILMDVQFDIGMDGFKVYPVITRSGRYRSSIGIVFARNLQLLFKPDDTDLDEFIIR